jgi:hypothetical protein
MQKEDESLEVGSDLFPIMQKEDEGLEEGSDLFPMMQKEDKGLVVGSDLFPMMQQEDSTPDKMRHQVLSGWIWEMVLAVNGGY